MTIRHAAFEEEQQRLDKTMQIIDKEITQLRADLQEATDDTVKQMVNATKARDLFHLEGSRQKPYFGRIDFLKDETYELDSVYIGKRGVVDSDTIDAVVIDWRAPIAGLYYTGESKDAFYRTPQGIVRGEVRLKRNFAIEDGEIKGIYDGALKETINREMGDPDEFLDEGFIDEFLASSLNETNDSRLKDIVATIQSEQNEIIRADKDRAVVVQGVAGSGKTTIALHRLSYLIYNYQQIASKRFMVFAPNKLFLNYISDVLPELGVDDVQQSTFTEWAAKQIKSELPKGWRILDPSKPLHLFFENKSNQDREKEIAWNRMHFKGSRAFRDTLEAYTRYLLEELIQYKSLRFIYKKTEHVFEIKGAEIKQLFLEEFAHLPFQKRLDALRKHLKQVMTKQFYTHLRENKIDLDKNGLIKFEKQIEQVLDRYLEKWPTMEVFTTYREIVTNQELLRKLTPAEVADQVVADTVTSSTEIYEQERLEVEDLAALIYLKNLIIGIETDQFDHTIVDEAQDLSVMEIAVVSLVTKSNSVTIVGDIAQGIHAYRGLHTWEEIIEGVFKRQRVDFYTLEQSYRSTIEIMRWSNRMLERAQAETDIEGLTFAKPVVRHGEEPKLFTCTSRAEMLADVVRRVEELSQKLSSIAIVTKTIEQSKKIHKSLKDKLQDLALLGVKDTEYPGGVTVMPAYLTKGLQFDVVILLDVDAENYTINEMDAKLLYVAMTRPVHKLFIYVTGEHTPLLAGESVQEIEL
ncbi:HelD family protein [Brevibacillus dissolubilis]|uniref:HelD family protein n=1 Tax=Brevibacillus dissolubilis TaxID=1844116 RepID=UPI00111612F6|nr:UvrD-helicase domain-containing protein [Brevibacillus dissolubilis]